MAFIRKIKKKDSIYLAEVENQWINGKVVQKHIRYIGKQPEKNRSSFLKKEDKTLTRIEIITELDSGKSKEDIAILYGVKIKTISNIEEKFKRDGIKGLIHTRANNVETVKVSTPEQAAIITDFVQNPTKTVKELKERITCKLSSSNIKKIISPLIEHLKSKKKKLLEPK